MAKKNKTLPKDFEDIVKRGNLDELKAVFKKCEINAHVRYGSNTALFFRDLPLEFVTWFIEQGGDIHHVNKFGDTPLAQQAKFKAYTKEQAQLFKDLTGFDTQVHQDNSPTLELLINLGAEVEPKQGTLPLVSACRSFNVTAVKFLLRHGANPLGNPIGFNSPLTEMLRQLAPIPEALEISQLLLSLDVPITNQMKELVQLMGKKFENSKLEKELSEYEKYRIETNEPVMHELYRLFDVEPIKPRQLYDGHSPITVKDTDDLQQAFSELWDLLVLPSGQCNTVQGEVIRITGRIADEIGRNGGYNWKEDHKKMLDSLMTYFTMGNRLSDIQLSQAEQLKKQVYFGNQHCYKQAIELSNLAVLWVKENPNPIIVTNPPYQF